MRADKPVYVTVIDLIARPGSTCTGFVSELNPADAPHCVEHTCEESFLKMMFPDHRATRELEKITQPLRTVVKRLGVAPLVPARQAPFALAVPCGAAPTATALHDTLHHTIVYSCKHSLIVKDKHGRVLAEHTLRVVRGSPVPESGGEANQPAPNEEHVVQRNLWVFPRVDRLGSVLTNKAAAFSISVPNADNATAGELLFINMNAFCGIRPRAIKLSIRRTMRCRLNAPATRAALSPFRKALLPSASTDSTSSARTIISRSTARYNALSTRAHTLPPGITIPSVTVRRSVPSRARQASSTTSESAFPAAPTRHTSLPVVVAASELSEMPSSTSRGSRNGTRSGAETQQTVEFVATVQRVIIGKPFGHSFDGCFYIRIPQTCFSVKTELVEVQHHLSVSLRFGMGRSLKKKVAVHIHQLESGGDGPLHVSTSPPGGWQQAFNLAGGRATSCSECPICFECMHGSQRTSMESRRASVDSRLASTDPASEATRPEAASEASPDVDGGVSCVTCSQAKRGDPGAIAAGADEDAGGKVLPVDAARPACTAQGGELMPHQNCSDSDSGSELLTSDGMESEVDEAVVRNCSVASSEAASDAAAVPPQGLPACMSSPVPLASLDLDASAPAAVAGGSAIEFARHDTSAECGGDVFASPAGSAVPPWLKEDLAVTDCGHVFHSVCLLRYEHAVAARGGTSPPSPQCPVCRQVYRRYLGALGAALN